MSDIDVQKMNAEQRLAEAARRSVALLPHTIQHQALELIKPESIAALGGLAVASQFIPAAPLIDAAIIAGTGFAAYDAVQEIARYSQQASNAQSEAQLDEAAKHFANGVIGGSLVGISARDAAAKIDRLAEQAAREAPLVIQKLREGLKGAEQAIEKLAERFPVTPEGVRVPVKIPEELAARPLESRAESRGNGTGQGQATIMREALSNLNSAIKEVKDLKEEGLSFQAKAGALSEQAKTASPKQREQLLEQMKEAHQKGRALLEQSEQKGIEVLVGEILRDAGDLLEYNRPVESVYRPGKRIGEVDAAGSHALIEATVSEDGKQSQIQKYFQSQEYELGGRGVILYAPNYTKSAAGDIEKAGGYVVRNEKELIELYRDLQSGIKPSINPKASSVRAKGLDPLSADKAFELGEERTINGENYKYGFHEKEIYEGNKQGAIYKFPIEKGKLVGEGIPIKAKEVPKDLLKDLLNKDKITQEQFNQLKEQAKYERDLHPAFKAAVKTAGITSAAAVTAQQAQPTEAQETPQPQRVETSVSAAIVSSDQTEAPEPERLHDQPRLSPEMAAIHTFETLINSKGKYDSQYHLTRFTDGDYVARLNEQNIVSVESSRGSLLAYDKNTEKLFINTPLNETDIQHFQELQTKLDASQQEPPKVEPPARPQPTLMSGYAADSFISQEQLDAVEDVARDYAYRHPDNQRVGEEFSYQNKEYQFAQKDQVLTITAHDGRDVILQMNTYDRELIVNKVTPEDSRQISEMPSVDALKEQTQEAAALRDGQARTVTLTALAVLDRYGVKDAEGRSYEVGAYQIRQQGDGAGPISISRQGKEVVYAESDGVKRENLGEGDIQNFTNLKAQIEQQEPSPPAAQQQQLQQEIGQIEY
jgi:hypothetical protein